MSTEPRRRWLSLLLQLLGSALVIGLLLRHVEWEPLRDAFTMVDWRWLALVPPARAISVTLHELRLYQTLRAWGRPSLLTTLGIGYTSGLTNTVLPLRGGDVLAVALLRKECGVSTMAALTAVGATSVIEALVFGVLLLILLITQGATWAAGVAELDLASAQRDLGLLTAGATMAVVGAVIVLRRLHTRRAPEPGPARGITTLLADAGRGRGAARVAVNAGLALIQVVIYLGSLLLLFLAIGIDPVPALLAAALFQAAGSLASTVLPQTMGAGQAASAVLVLATFGVPSAPALAVAAMLWASHQGTTLALGALPTWRRLGELGKARAGSTGSASPGGDPPESAPAP